MAHSVFGWLWWLKTGLARLLSEFLDVRTLKAGKNNIFSLDDLKNCFRHVSESQEFLKSGNFIFLVRTGRNERSKSHWKIGINFVVLSKG